MALTTGHAARRGRAIERLTALMQAISDNVGIPGPKTDMHSIRTGTDPFIAQMLEVEAFGDWAAQLAEQLGVAVPSMEPPEPPPVLPFDGVPLSGLQTLARDRGIAFDEATSEATLRRMLRIHHGFPAGGAEAPAPAEESASEGDDTDVEFGALTVAQLRDLAAERNVDVSALKRKADIIAALHAAEDAGKGAAQ